ncbi:hypothetical protein ABEDC_2485 [Acinetobacter lwoffii]|nr:hypothetical protein ABEDC_2485 [Acinetobacter lwoffii]
MGSCRYVSEVQIPSLISCWIPYIKVVSPLNLQENLLDELKIIVKVYCN